MRWGRRFEGAGDRLQYAVEIVENIIVPKADDAVAVTRKLGTTSFISIRLRAMLTAIELDHELARRAGKIGDPLSDWMLSPKLPRYDAFAQGSPENPFDIGGLLAQAPRDLGSCSQCLYRPHLTQPLRPQAGSGEEKIWEFEMCASSRNEPWHDDVKLINRLPRLFITGQSLTPGHRVSISTLCALG